MQKTSHMNELRRDYFLDRWVIFATERARRPSDFIKARAAAETQECSFCPGYEDKTPPSKASYFDDRHEPDEAGKPPQTGWTVRVIPNLYPAVKMEGPAILDGSCMTASGVHEVIVESPVHDRHPQFMSDEEVERLFTVYRDRFAEIASIPFIKYISMFRNYGREAGASLAHAHSQVIALPIVPEKIKEQHGLDYGRVIKREEASPRLILSSTHSIAFAPFASCYTYETWIFPKRPCKNLAELSDEERDDLALVTRDVLSRLSRLLSDPPYNYAFVQSVGEKMHMHLRIYPKLGIEAGFELNTGIHINSVTPESAAKSLREA
ncbi:Galactose-1-phosphate uridylyltransferase [Methanocella conradii HZ254]|uniref:Galactose-1-phosphate uridylyltransferase n=2 Tax=Methanocella TaxID=570266 RepID=H8I536_METCZ|nr:Galactose-1-phosphate uridylyltransferase [Methanocella conradii HZ254]